LTLPKDIFRGLTSLKALQLTDLNLIQIPSGIFSDLVSLKKLDLRDNHLTTLPNNIFDGPDSLESLDLRNNMIVEVNESVFAIFENPATTVVRLGSNRLSAHTRSLLESQLGNRLNLAAGDD
jgi:Leucine-rich repeat (LRR) protein